MTVNHGLHDVVKKFGIQKFTVIIESLLVFYCRRSDFQQIANKARYDVNCVQECPNFNLGAGSSTANVLRAPGSTLHNDS